MSSSARAVTVSLRPVDPRSPEIVPLIERHLVLMRASSPACSVHAMDAGALAETDAYFLAAFDEDRAIGMGAIKAVNSDLAEIKSMHVIDTYRGQPIAHEILATLMAEATRRGFNRVSLETGSQDVFEPARRFYQRNGFSFCPPFEGYAEDPNSVFMTRALRPEDRFVFRIVRADAADLHPLLEAHRVFSEDKSPETARHSLSATDLVDADAEMVLVYDGDMAVACGGLKPLEDGTAEVKSIHVLPAARGHGIAKRVMQELQARAAKAGYIALVLETGSEKLPDYAPARRLYERLGYIECGPIPGYDAHPDSLFMCLPLEPGHQTSHEQDQAVR